MFSVLKNLKKKVPKISLIRRRLGNKPNYDIVLSQESLDKIISYKNDLNANDVEPGFYLKQIIDTKKTPLNHISTEEFVEYLLLTKKPIIFAESELGGGSLDWNEIELQILGDLSIAMNVEIYDNGVWEPYASSFSVHEPSLNGTLLFIPGPLLRDNFNKGMFPDLNEIASGNNIDQEKYNRLIERRLMPLFYYANENAKEENQRAFITIPGVGCGMFAGKFRGKMGEHLNQALQYILKKHAKNYNNIVCVYFDPFNECRNETQQFDRVSYRVRPALQNSHKPQLCHPNEYEETEDDFSNCKLHKVVAWDHLSFPGNDYFAASRNTDDGVAAAATNSMEIITGIKGRYDRGDYFPPEGNNDWEQLVHKNKITLRAKDNVKVVTADGLLFDLKE